MARHPWIRGRRGVGRVYNVGDPENFTELDWRRQFAEAAGWTGRFVVLPDEQVPAHLKARGNLRQHWAVESTRIRQELGYLVGLSRQRVNEALKTLQTRGCIRIEYGGVRVIDIDALRGFS